MADVRGPLDLDELHLLKQQVVALKRNVFRQAESAGAGYVAQGLCAAEVVGSLYFHKLRLKPDQLDWADRDRLVLSVGHYAIALYAAMAELGCFAEALLETYSADGSELEQIATEVAPGIEVGGGSLGQGLSQGVGLALAAQLRGHRWHTYIFMSDGELEEGQTWEAAMVAAHYRLENLTLIVDVNGVQADGFMKDVTALSPISDKWRAFGWHVSEINGNDLSAVVSALDRGEPEKPHVILSSTKMGNGVSWLEGRPDVHYIKWTNDDTERAMAEIEAKAGDSQ